MRVYNNQRRKCWQKAVHMHWTCMSLGLARPCDAWNYVFYIP
jgi:hypothetical protein